MTAHPTQGTSGMNLGKNIKDIDINKIYVGMTIIQKHSWGGTSTYEVVLVKIRPSSYDQIVLMALSPAAESYLKLICHKGNLENNYYYAEV